MGKPKGLAMRWSLIKLFAFLLPHAHHTSILADM